MDFNPTTLICSILFGAIGTGYFIYGRKQQKWIPLVSGIVLGVYPYFVSNVLLMVLIGVGLTALPILYRD